MWSKGITIVFIYVIFIALKEIGSAHSGSGYCSLLLAQNPRLCEQRMFLAHCHSACLHNRSMSDQQEMVTLLGPALVCNDKEYNNVYSRTCYDCPSISDPKKCTKQVQCEENELCVVTQALDVDFSITYRLGCIPQKECSSFIHGGQRSTTLLGDCCSNSLCNNYKPESLHETLECYNCTEVYKPSRCRATTKCSPGELCVITQALDADFNIVYRHGCMPRHSCDAFIHTGMQKLRSTHSLRGDCCETDLCNNYNTSHVCEDVDTDSCKAVFAHNSHSCHDNDFRRTFCPKTCGHCVNCYRCTLHSHENKESNCHGRTSCFIDSHKACGHSVSMHNGDIIHSRNCVLMKHCTNVTTHPTTCCTGDMCNDFSQSTTDHLSKTTTGSQTATSSSTTYASNITTSFPTTSTKQTTHASIVSTGYPTTQLPTSGTSTSDKQTTLQSTTKAISQTTQTTKATTQITRTTFKPATLKPTSQNPTLTNTNPTSTTTASPPWLTLAPPKTTTHQYWLTIGASPTSHPEWITIPAK